MFSRLLSHLARAFADASFALGMGFKGAWRPAVLLRSGVIAVAAGSVTLWLFARHWEVAQWFALAFVPLLLLSFGLTGLQADHARFSAPATTAGAGFDPVGGVMDLAHGLSGLAHAAVALALAVACGLLLCGLLLTLLLSRGWLWPDVVRRARDKLPSLQPAPAEAPSGGLWRALRRVVLALAISQVIYVAAMFVPHLGFLWFLLLAYYPAALVAEFALRSIATPAERDAVLRRGRLPFVLFGLLVLASACVPVLNLLAPAMLAIGAARLGYRLLAAVRGEKAAGVLGTRAAMA